MSRRSLGFIGDDPGVWSLLCEWGRAHEKNPERYRSVAELVARIPQGEIACVLVDIDHDPSAAESILQELQRRYWSGPVIFVGSTADASWIVRALRRGAVDYLQKPCSPELLSAAVSYAVREDDQRRVLLEQYGQLKTRLELVTPAEREVMRRMVEGQPNKQIAAALDIGLRTVELRRARILDKMGAESLAELVRMVTTLEIVRQWILREDP